MRRPGRRFACRGSGAAGRCWPASARWAPHPAATVAGVPEGQCAPDAAVALSATPPESFAALFQNLKAVMQQGSLFDEAFYTQENIGRLTGTTDITIFRGDEGGPTNVVRARTKGFPDIFWEQDRPKIINGGVDYFLHKNPSYIFYRFSRDQEMKKFSLSDISGIFPCNWRIEMPDFIPNLIRQPPTHPYGNKNCLAKYRFDKYDYNIAIGLYHDATIRYFIFVGVKN